MNLLIVNPFGIGDVIFTTPLIRAIKERYPDGILGYICNRRTSKIIDCNPHINKVFIYERDEHKAVQASSYLRWFAMSNNFIKQIKQNKFDAALDLSLNTHFGFFLMCAGIKRRIGYNYKNRGFFLTDSLFLPGYENKHIVEYYCELLRFLEIDIKDKKLELNISDSDIQYAERIVKQYNIDGSVLKIAIAPGGGASWGINRKLKQWPVQNFAYLADKLIEKNRAMIIILGDINDCPLAVYIQEALRRNVINLCGLTDLGQMAAVIKIADLVIANDGGPLHIATALDKRTLSFFGPVDPVVYGPFSMDKNQHIVLRNALSCSPCYRRFRLTPCRRNKECLEGITVCSVHEAAEYLLKA